MPKLSFIVYYSIIILIAMVIGIAPWVVFFQLNATTHSATLTRHTESYGGHHPLCTLTTRIDRFYFGGNDQ